MELNELHREVVSAEAEETSSWFSKALSAGISLVLVVVVCCLVAVSIGPKLLGGNSLTVLSGSMEPTYQVGDLLLVVPEESYGIGDAITFQAISGDPTLITHRIVAQSTGASGTVFTTRGDANGADDDPIVFDQIVGKVHLHVPFVGYFSLFVGEHRTLILMTLGLLLIGYCGYCLLGRKKQNEPKTT